MKPTRRTPTAKATKCWANVYKRSASPYAHPTEVEAKFSCGGDGRTVPAYLITQEQVEACVEKMALSIARSINPRLPKYEAKRFAHCYIDDARAALSALGIRGGKRK